MIDLVREKQTIVKSITLANLITLDVHNEKAIKNLLVKSVKRINELDWIMNMSYYWDKSEKPDEYNYVVKSVQTDFSYGYEYVGNTEILVITPLKVKCNLTLMGALRLNLRGAPPGSFSEVIFPSFTSGFTMLWSSVSWLSLSETF